MGHKTIYDNDFNIQKSDHEFDYQADLTKKLDADRSEFNQERLNEIVLWKVNRFAEFNDEAIQALNSIKPNQEKLDIEETKRVLRLLLNTKGVQLAMASTILRFRNPKIYQIIDQRVYRIIYPGKELNASNYKSVKNIEKQIDLYLEYLIDLKNACVNLGIDFEFADRILFMADRRINKAIKLKNY